jgi:hypothetical protein
VLPVVVTVKFDGKPMTTKFNVTIKFNGKKGIASVQRTVLKPTGRRAAGGNRKRKRAPEVTDT